ncbi:hypothetical protein Naga_103901g1, partial [Nannochloropsis gaditana]
SLPFPLSRSQIRAIIDQFSLSELDVSDQGVVSVCSFSTESNQAAAKFIEDMYKDEVKASNTVEFKGPMPEVGTVFRDVEIKGTPSLPLSLPLALCPSLPPSLPDPAIRLD